MRTQPVAAAAFSVDADGVPWSDTYRDRYHPAGGAAAQARHVFIAGNGLPGRWRGRERFTILETGFGLGNNFLAAWDAWRGDPARSERLDFVSIEKHPFERDALARLHAAQNEAIAQTYTEQANREARRRGFAATRELRKRAASHERVRDLYALEAEALQRVAD